MTEQNPHIQAHGSEVDYDRHEPQSGLIAIISIATLALLVVMIGGVYWLYVVSYEHVDQAQYSGVASKELDAIHQREADQLYKYSFIDKEKGVVRLPVDRAMDIVAAEFAQGVAAYNTKSYAVKVEGPGGAAAPPTPPAPAALPGAAPAKPVTPAVPAASTK